MSVIPALSPFPTATGTLSSTVITTFVTSFSPAEQESNIVIILASSVDIFVPPALMPTPLPGPPQSTPQTAIVYANMTPSSTGLSDSTKLGLGLGITSAILIVFGLVSCLVRRMRYNYRHTRMGGRPPRVARSIAVAVRSPSELPRSKEDDDLVTSTAERIRRVNEKGRDET